MLLVSTMILSGVISFLTSFWLIKNSNRLALVDVPNIRSSHSNVMPKGGGIGIALGVLIGLGVYHLTGLFTIEIKYLAIITGFLAMALLGFFSDRFSISVSVRLILQLIIAGFTVYLIGMPVSFEIGVYTFNIGLAGALAAVLWLVSVTNFYNFMDGIDGLAAMEGIIAGIGIAIFGIMLREKALIPMGLFLSIAITGFLLLNFPPAKIFMGDTGSYAIGFYIALFALVDKRLIVPIGIILGVFIFDTVLTLARRILKGEDWLKAHKNHFYQRAVKLGYSHRKVTSILSFVSILLTAMACIYLEVSLLFQILIIIVTICLLSCLALLVAFKEKRKDT